MGLLGHKENEIGRETEPSHPPQANNRAVRLDFPNQTAECSCAHQVKRLLARIHTLAENRVQPMMERGGKKMQKGQAGVRLDRMPSIWRGHADSAACDPERLR